MNRRSLATWSVALMLLLTGGKTVAWEADVREGLTKWLAQQAGFTEREADRIAQGDGGMDESDYTSAPQAVFLGIILRGDLGALEKMQQWHFPSDAQLPCAPENRVVAHDGPAARDPVRQMINSPYSDRDSALRDLGERLHAYQDS